MASGGLQNFGGNVPDAANNAFSDALDDYILARPTTSPESVLRFMMAFVAHNPK